MKNTNMTTNNPHISTVFQAQKVQQAADFMAAGGILAYPTESVWGLGCNPLDEQVVTRLLALKKRPVQKGVILVAGEVAQVAAYMQHLPASTQKQMLASWQPVGTLTQATTWLIPLTTAQGSIAQFVPSWITGTHQSVAVRVTPHPLVQALCVAYGGVIVSTSCNVAGEPAAKDLAVAQQYFAHGVSFLAGDTLGFEKPSRIINATTDLVVR